ncbi:hypothetical protein F2P56_004300 [Juglans regia]|uniref:Retrotransposon Copia-like N-terminal domain-containing protein n=1 Tax=Juglans regia TaxID=51240 RepID=A0A833Y3Q0_JUGRE|nr:hypothetical protein F2P56_004300 [Juglans regia]
MASSISSDDSDPTSTSTINTPPLNSASHFITMKLTVDNYLLWKAQVVHFLKGNHLFHHVDSSSIVPPPLIDNNPNPEYHKWSQLDQLLISASNSSLSENVLAWALKCIFAHEIWTTFQNLFAAQSSVHLMQTQL